MKNDSSLLNCEEHLQRQRNNELIGDVSKDKNEGPRCVHV